MLPSVRVWIVSMVSRDNVAAAALVQQRRMKYVETTVTGQWTTRGHANSRIANTRTGHLADVAGSSCSF